MLLIAPSTKLCANGTVVSLRGVNVGTRSESPGSICLTASVAILCWSENRSSTVPDTVPFQITSNQGAHP